MTAAATAPYHATTAQRAAATALITRALPSFQHNAAAAPFNQGVAFVTRRRPPLSAAARARSAQVRKRATKSRISAHRRDRYDHQEDGSRHPHEAAYDERLHWIGPRWFKAPRPGWRIRLMRRGSLGRFWLGVHPRRVVRGNVDRPLGCRVGVDDVFDLVVDVLHSDAERHKHRRKSAASTSVRRKPVRIAVRETSIPA